MITESKDITFSYYFLNNYVTMEIASEQRLNKF